jgi:hypothetical protein
MAMSGAPTGPRGAGPAGAPADDWPAQAADLVERVVTTVRDKAVVPIEKVARLVVYGIVAGVVGLIAVVLLIAALVRLLDVVLPSEVWLAHAVLGGIFVLAGALVWSRRGTRPGRG